ncbi:hypothetical protein R1sor_027063 [Riccia sorocarpa]|uniref:Reverse transcriptase zinc-binding domain-containing protein n=1 Tax=Riccia sorocarpa TaxID=122646 RepID=A0ABD3GD74_9MARC
MEKSDLKITAENPFQSYCSLVIPHPNKVELGHEVSFEGSRILAGWSGRAPKKKGSSQPESQRTSQAGKRRALGSVDHNGACLAERQNIGSNTEDEQRRERKMRNDGLRQEVKVDSWSIRRWLKGMLKEGTLIYDKPVGSKGDIALILCKGMQVLASGTSGRGRMVWVKLEKEEGRRKTESYFKMCHLELKNPEVLLQVKEAWMAELASVHDDRRRLNERENFPMGECFSNLDCESDSYQTHVVPDSHVPANDNWMHEEGSKGTGEIVQGVFVGNNRPGNTRKALISWKRLSRPKQLGGLGYLSFDTRAKALQIRHVTDLLEGDHEGPEWVLIARRMIAVKLLNGPNKLERKWWKNGEALLLLSVLRLPEAPILDKLLKVWFEMKKQLFYSRDPGILPVGLPILSLKTLWSLSGQENTRQFKPIEMVARRNKYNIMGDICDEEGRIRAQFLEEVQLSSSTQDGEARKWEQEKSFKGLSRRWDEHVDSELWRIRWREVWEGPILFTQKMWLWRILNIGVITGDWAAKWGVADGTCIRCNLAKEPLEHLLWDCQKVRGQAEWLSHVIMGAGIGKPSFLQVVDHALSYHTRNPGMVMLIYEFTWLVWKERNRFVFDANESVASAAE